MKTVLYKDDEHHIDCDEEKELIYYRGKTITYEEYGNKTVDLWGANDGKTKKHNATQYNVVYAILETFKDKYGVNI